MNLRVVATPQAAQGLEGVLPDALAVVSGIRPFSDTVLQVLGRSDSSDRSEARSYVRVNYDWDKNLTDLDRILAAALDARDSGGDRTHQP